MQKTTLLSIILLVTLSTVSVKAQNCDVAQTGSDTNFLGRNSSNEVFVGQSFDACQTGALLSATIRVAAGSISTNAELRVYSGAPTTPSGSENLIPANLLYTQSTILPTPATGTTDDHTVTLSGPLNLTNGQTYTIGFARPATGGGNEIVRFRNDNLNSFAGGTMVASEKLPGNASIENQDSDLIFTFTVSDTTLNTLNPVAQLSTFYPNPSSGLITVTGVDVTSLEILNLLGQKVLSSRAKTINTETLSQGNYFLKINTKIGSTIKNIVLK